MAVAAPQTRSSATSAASNKPTTSAQGGEQILEFPNRMMGKLYPLKFKNEFGGSSWDKHRIADAQGKVRLPAKMLVRLELSYAGAEDPSPLVNVNSPALIAIDLRNLENCDDRTMDVIGRIKTLTDVNCAEADVTDAGLVKLLPLKDRLTQLDVQKTLITGEGLATIGKMTKLERLAAGYNQLTDESLKYLEPLQNLRFLWVPSSQLSDKCLVHIAKLHNLAELELFNNQKISSKGMDILAAGLPNLSMLTVNGTYVDDKAIGAFSKMKHLTTLVIDFKYLKPAQVEAIRRVLPRGCNFHAPTFNGVVGPDLLGPLH